MHHPVRAAPHDVAVPLEQCLTVGAAARTGRRLGRGLRFRPDEARRCREAVDGADVAPVDPDPLDEQPKERLCRGALGQVLEDLTEELAERDAFEAARVALPGSGAQLRGDLLSPSAELLADLFQLRHAISEHLLGHRAGLECPLVTLDRAGALADLQVDGLSLLAVEIRRVRTREPECDGPPEKVLTLGERELRVLVVRSERLVTLLDRRPGWVLAVADDVGLDEADHEIDGLALLFLGHRDDLGRLEDERLFRVPPLGRSGLVVGRWLLLRGLRRHRAPLLGERSSVHGVIDSPGPRPTSPRRGTVRAAGADAWCCSVGGTPSRRRRAPSRATCRKRGPASRGRRGSRRAGRRDARRRGRAGRERRARAKVEPGDERRADGPSGERPPRAVRRARQREQRTNRRVRREHNRARDAPGDEIADRDDGAHHAEEEERRERPGPPEAPDHEPVDPGTERTGRKQPAAGCDEGHGPLADHDDSRTGGVRRSRSPGSVVRER